MFSVVRRISKIKERRQHQSFFQLGYYRKKGQNSEKSVLGSSTGENVFCILETNDGRRKQIRRTLFSSARRFCNKGHKPEKTVLSSSPGEGVFCTLETKYGRGT
jgi:hypothetical protein